MSSKLDLGRAQGLQIVATPIGNFGDISLRAVEALKTADVIYCEDTRVSLRLLTHFGITDKKLKSANEHTEGGLVQDVLNHLKNNATVVLISDAGTPNINDPGYHLVKACLTNNINVTPIPGPSSLTAALSASPIGGGHFVYLGYLPRKQGELSALLRSLPEALEKAVFLESPKRLLSSLKLIKEVFGNKSEVCLYHELTKIHESIHFGKIDAILDEFNNKEILGEWIGILSLRGRSQTSLNIDSAWQGALQNAIDLKIAPSNIVEIFKPLWPRSKKELYNLILEKKEVSIEK
ncbi:MAG: 16S rRNA (cytidine(1402)-2'-O)-methyltransferase [Bdellovibrionales bacterium CG10_big_fil_rev_8_21_14_0_10_45_34]|nr:MAG: 16S rRNA (cytidine(1402)-2'-O)-methyltransferase [Bdellovibrionales bacterium CG10_big_fil_rev_8_21_14_0_10_45_34]